MVITSIGIYTAGHQGGIVVICTIITIINHTDLAIVTICNNTWIMLLIVCKLYRAPGRAERRNAPILVLYNYYGKKKPREKGVKLVAIVSMEERK